MTPECPKGPERPRVAYEPREGDRVMWRHLHFGTVRVDAHGESCISLDQCGTVYPSWRQHVQPDDGIGFPNWHDDSAAEVERLTAEVERLRAELEGAEDGRAYLKRGVCKALNPLFTDQQVDKLLIDPVRLAELTAGEVSRLREQLGPAKLGAAVHQERADQLVIGLRRLLDKDREIENGPRESATSEASPLVHNVVLSSEEGAFGHWHVTCSCHEASEGDLAHAEFWKDQHLADTLVPVKSSNHQANQHDEGRPSGSTATPRSDEDEVQTSEFQVGDEVRWCWTGKNADGTWFNARLTEKHPHHYPKGWAGEVTDCGTAYTAEHMGEVPLGFKLFMDIPSLTLVSRPSPSLRKEGEDTPMPAVSSQEEKKEGEADD